MANVADIILEVLADAGVKHIFSIPGGGINTIVEAIRRQDRIQMVMVRHEETGAFAASAIAKLTGRLGVCMGTSGPGAIHLLNGLYDAKLDHAPVLSICGQVSTSKHGLQSHQEVKLEQLFSDVASYNQTIINEEQLPYVVEEAVRTAIGHRAVANLIVPEDIADATVSNPGDRTNFLINDSIALPSHHSFVQAAKIINNSGRIAILIGQGARHAAYEVLALADMLKAPIAKTLNGKFILPDNHPLVMGGLGLLGAEPSQRAVNNCDCLLMIGTSFPYVDFLPKGTPTVQIDINPSKIGKRIPVQAGLVGDAKAIVAELLQYLHPKHDATFLEDRQREKERWLEKLMTRQEPFDHLIRPQALAAEVGHQALDDAVFCLDTGNVTVWCARHIRATGQQLITLSGGLATMGYALGAAIGAQLTFPHRQVIAMIGDGGFSMMMGDLQTLVQYQLPVKVVVFNNHKLGMIQLEQEVMGYPEYMTRMHNANFAMLAEACGIPGIKVTEPDRMEEAVAIAFGTPGPFLLDVEVNPEEIVWPPQFSASEAFGYAKAKVLEAVTGD